MVNLVSRGGYYQLYLDGQLLRRLDADGNPEHSGNHTNLIECLETLFWAMRAGVTGENLELIQPRVNMRYDDIVGRSAVQLPPAPGFTLVAPGIQATPSDGSVRLVVDDSQSVNHTHIAWQENINNAGYGAIQLASPGGLDTVLTPRTNGLSHKYRAYAYHQPTDTYSAVSIEVDVTPVAAPVGSPEYLFLTPADLTRIQQQIADHKTTTTLWPIWPHFAARMEDHVGNGTTTQNNMQGDQALYLLSGEASPAFEAWYKTSIFVQLTNYLAGDMIRGRAQGALLQLLCQFVWIDKHNPTFFTSGERSQLLSGIETGMAACLTDMENRLSSASDSFWAQDSDFAVFSYAYLLLFKYANILTPANQQRVEDMLAAVEALPNSVYRYFREDKGIFASGVGFESGSYGANTPWAYSLAYRMKREAGLAQFNPNYPTNRARWLYTTAMWNPAGVSDAGNYMGVLEFNDSASNDGTAISIGQYGGTSSNFRVLNTYTGALCLFPDATSEEYRSVTGLLDSFLESDTNKVASTSFDRMWPRILTEIPSSPPIAPENVTLPLYHQAKTSAPVLAARNERTINASQFIAMCWLRFHIHHWGGSGVHYEVFHKGAPITKFLCLAAGGMSTGINPYNALYFENADKPPNNWNSVGTMQGPVDGTQYGRYDLDNASPIMFGDPFGNAEFASFGCHSPGFRNNPEYNGVLFDGRRILNVFPAGGAPGLTLTFDRGIIDPTESYGGVTGPLDMLRVQRFERQPTFSGGWYSTPQYLGVEVHFRELIQTFDSRTIVDESSYDTAAPTYKRWHLQDIKNAQTDMQALGLLVYGDAGGVTLPTVNAISAVNSGAVTGVLLTGSRDVVLLFNTDPRIPLSGNIDVDFAAAIPAGTEYYVCDAAEGVQYQAARSGAKFTLTAGSGAAVPSHRIANGTVA